MAFRFRLENILRLRNKLKEAKKAELAYVESQIAFLIGEIKQIRKRISELGLKEAYEGDFKDLQRKYLEFEVELEREREILEQLKKLDEERERIISELIELEKDVKIIEKLKSRKKAEYIKEVIKKEIKFLDELALRRREE